MIIAPPASTPVAIPPVVVTPSMLHRAVPTPTQALYRGMVKLTPEEAVMKAADAAPRPVVGVFEFEVRRAEQVGPNFFIGSEGDYRDPRNLSARILPRALAELHARFGPDLSKAFIGRKVRVVGGAMRVRVDFIGNGQPTGKYYYQTQLPVGDANQIETAN